MGAGGTESKTPKIVIDFDNISKNQYFCPECDRVPEILNIQFNKSHLELMCKIHGIIDLTVENYLNQKNKKDKKEGFKYCCYCENYFCEKCLIDESVHPKYHLNDSQKEKDIHLYCMDCEEIIYKLDENLNFHKSREILELDHLRNEVLKYRDIILEKNTLK